MEAELSSSPVVVLVKSNTVLANNALIAYGIAVHKLMRSDSKVVGAKISILNPRR
jgi:hypothetical protein